MNMKIINLARVIGGFGLMLATQIAGAAVVWTWSFLDDNITLSPTETLYIGGTLINDSSSTENLRIGAYSLWVTGDLSNNDLDGGLYTYNPTTNEPGGLFAGGQDTNIAPGNSYAFTIAHFNPLQPISVGSQFSLSVQLFHDWYGPSEASITRTLNVAIAETVVPLPPSLLLLLSGIFSFFMPAIARKSLNHLSGRK
ncbi:MAG: hypothetical protein AB1560_08265 [Pseudomonadota bacterium]